MRFAKGFNKPPPHQTEVVDKFQKMREQHSKPERFEMSKKSQLKVMANIGSVDVARGFPDARDGDVITVNDDTIRDQMLKQGLAVEVGGPDAESQPEEEESPVDALNVPEAVEKIKHMRKAENLQRIIDTDARGGVKSAAERRLAELQEKA